MVHIKCVAESECPGYKSEREDTAPVLVRSKEANRDDPEEDVHCKLGQDEEC